MLHIISHKKLESGFRLALCGEHLGTYARAAEYGHLDVDVDLVQVGDDAFAMVGCVTCANVLWARHQRNRPLRTDVHVDRKVTIKNIPHTIIVEDDSYAGHGKTGLIRWTLWRETAYRPIVASGCGREIKTALNRAEQYIKNNW